MTSGRIELFFWELKDEITGKWRRTSWRMTEEDARTRHGDNARKIEATLEVRSGVGAGFTLGHPRSNDES